MTKRVFVCSPLSGDIVRNKKKAALYCRWVAQQGFFPYAPHVFCTQFLDDSRTQDRVAGINIGLSFLEACDEIWVFGSTLSMGMQQEVDLAKRKGLSIRTFEDHVVQELFLSGGRE